MDITTIFGYEIVMHVQPRLAHRQYVGFPGGHGVVAMNLGTRGRAVTVSGRLAATGVNYNTARMNLQTWINDIEYYITNASAYSYTYHGGTYWYVLFDELVLIPDAQNKVFHFNSGGYVFCNFVCYGRMLI